MLKAMEKDVFVNHESFVRMEALLKHLQHDLDFRRAKLQQLDAEIKKLKGEAP